MATKKVKPKACRIPTFGLRNPQIETRSIELKSPLSSETQISKLHVGRSVQHGDKHGFLKYVGRVHFAEGVWCGIELTDALGKHDGTIKGVRYFSCSQQRGLMAPVSKVALTKSNSEAAGDNSSGPYSILCLNSVPANSSLDEKRSAFRPVENNLSYAQNSWKTNFNGGEHVNDFRRHLLAERDLKIPSIDSFDTVDVTYTSSQTSNKAYSIENLTKLPFQAHTKDISLSAENLNQLEPNRISEYKEISQCEKYCGTKPKKRTNDTFCSKAQINKSCEDILKETTRKRRKSNVDPAEQTVSGQHSTRVRSDLHADHKPEIFHELVKHKCRNTAGTEEASKIRNTLTLEKPTSLPQLRIVHQLLPCSTPRSSFADLSNSQPIRSHVLEDIKRAHVDIDSENSKKDSLDCDESLGILTPEQMSDFNQLSYGLDWDKFAEGSSPDRAEHFEQNLSPIKPNNEDSSKLKPSSEEVQSPNMRRSTDKPEIFHELIKHKCRTTGASEEASKTVTLEKPSSLPQLRIVHQLHSCNTSRSSFGDLSSSQPIRSHLLEDIRRAHVDNDSENSKRDSLDCDESLGILTPEQMSDFNQLSFGLDWDKFVEDSSPDRAAHFEQNRSSIKLNNEDSSKLKPEEVQSPNINSSTDYSLGIIAPDQMISGFTFLSANTTMNWDLPLDSVAATKEYSSLNRCEETPSPEELPLDTTPIVESEPSKTEPTKSKTSSFITSITSITSLDTGYQGDGEMSRPASRGADNSPLTRRPYSRAPPRKPDPMTDSDFYTESDADNHDDNHLKGDRKAQVIDGTLYGVDPQAAADIYVNNRENMDSSGVFTDIESGLRNDEADNGNDSEPERNNNRTANVSPSDSTKTFSENSQKITKESLIDKPLIQTDIDDKMSDKTVKENPKKRTASSPGLSTPSSLSSPRRLKDENPPKKYKLPNCNASKVKSKVFDSNPCSVEKKQVKKPVNKWEPIMTKITKNEKTKTSLKEIKSKVFENLNLGSTQKSNNNSEKSANNWTVVNLNNKVGRVPTRVAHNSSPMKVSLRGNRQNSNNSSLSDLSTSTSLTKKPPGSAKAAKKKESIQVTKVLTANQLTLQNQRNLTETKKNGSDISGLSLPPTNTKPKQLPLVSSKDKKLPSKITKESNKPTFRGGRTPPSVRPPAPLSTRTPAKKLVPSPRTAEALAVLVQHLVFNVGAYQVPQLKKQVDKYRLEAEEVRLVCIELETALSDIKLKNVASIEDERIRYRKDIADLNEKHRHQILQVNSQHAEAQEHLRQEKDLHEQQLREKHDEQLAKLRKELEKIQRSYEEALDILREENDCIREQIDENRSALEKSNLDNQKLRDDCESKETQWRQEVDILKQQKEKLKQQIVKLENEFQEKLKISEEENKRLRDQNDRLLSYGDHKDVAKQEVQSLRVVLELKQNEIADLRKSLEETRQKQQIFEGVEEKAAALHARCEDIEHQLQRKTEYEQTLIQENQKLQESLKENMNHSRRLSQHNEELQWKLRQNKEIFTKVIKQAEETVFNRSGVCSSSFNENHFTSQSISFKDTEKKLQNSSVFEEDISPPSTPKVKGVVEKSDSVSYVLDLDESPDLVASRILRRSFRNSTLPKNTPNKSPSTKQPKMKNVLSTSASSIALLPNNKEFESPISASSRNGDYEDDVFLWENQKVSSYQSENSSIKIEETLDLDEEINEEDLQLPALPSEMDKRNGILALPSPSRLAADSAGSESNSEDESTSSSQL
ncbi:restin homolog [Euwallacea fornicatus]|uniref:restin homolog n=1 Tax=Euwallacea fornicatus TaxID=995702 RepID=UPI00338E442E